MLGIEKKSYFLPLIDTERSDTVFYIHFFAVEFKSFAEILDKKLADDTCSE